MLREADRLAAYSAIHKERLSWVNARPGLLAATIGHDIDDWEIDAALVLDHPLAGARLRETVVPVWTFWELTHRLTH
jgi:hypothetical protein